jgi:hypothetical protein
MTKMTTGNPAPGRLAIVAGALAAHQKAEKPPKLLTRANALLTSILGENANLANLVDIKRDSAGDVPDGAEIIIEIDEMLLRFVPGGTPDDDFFQVRLLGAPVDRVMGIRTLAGLGYALSEHMASIRWMFEDVGLGMTIDEILQELRITGEFIAENKRK